MLVLNKFHHNQTFSHALMFFFLKPIFKKLTFSFLQKILKICCGKSWYIVRLLPQNLTCEPFKKISKSLWNSVVGVGKWNRHLLGRTSLLYLEMHERVLSLNLSHFTQIRPQIISETPKFLDFNPFPPSTIQVRQFLPKSF